MSSGLVARRWAAGLLFSGIVLPGLDNLDPSHGLAFGQGLASAPQTIADQDPVRQASDALNQWRKDWENRDFERFAAHYVDTFRNGSLDRLTYLERKRAIFERRPWQRIRLNEVLWIAEKSTPDALSVRFIQEYDSPQGSDRSRKEQRWTRTNQRWQLASETEVVLSETEASRTRLKSGSGGLGK